MIKRSIDFIKVAFFLSRYGQDGPPKILNTDSWKEAYHMFYDHLNEGRNILTFEHSLKNARDSFDSHFPETKRQGWKDSDNTSLKLRGVMLEVYNRFYNITEAEMWNNIKPSALLEIKNYKHIFEDLIGIQESEKDQNISRTEGGVKMIISQKVERDTRLRNQALSIHGYECMVCKFSFEAFYGAWGKDWAEVHHLSPIHKSKETKVETNPLQIW